MTYDHSLALSLGDACLVCRSDKKRCDGQHPICGRCLRLNKTCIFSKGVHRRKRTDILEDRIDALTAQIAALSRGHDRTIIAAKLFDKVKLLDSARRSVDSSTAPRRSGWIPAFPLTNQPYPLSDFAGGKVESDESQEGYRPVVLRSKIEDMFARWDPEQEVTPDMKMHLVSIWLPFRNHFQFYMDPERFVRAISLPEDHPRSMHPSLLNALYLSACSIAGGELSRYEPIFLARLRQHLAEQLAMADRLLDFIWANVILTSYFGRLARLVEAYATITSCARFAIACGLPGTEHSPEYPNLPLIPPPVDTEEQQERVDLCHSIYMTDRCFAICTGWPRAFITVQDVSRFELLDDSATESSGVSPSATIVSSPYSPMDSPLPPSPTLSVSSPSPNGNIRVSAMVIFERIELFARRFSDSGGRLLPSMKEEWNELDADLRQHISRLPAITDTFATSPHEHVEKANPNLIPAHVYTQGASIILNSLVSDDNYRAKRAMLDAANALAALGKQMMGVNGLRTIQTYVESIGHMLNAARIFARELKRPHAKQDTQYFADCCAALSDLIDFLDDLAQVHPVWAYVLDDLRAMLPDSADSLERLISL